MSPFLIASYLLMACEPQSGTDGPSDSGGSVDSDASLDSGDTGQLGDTGDSGDSAEVVVPLTCTDFAPAVCLRVDGTLATDTSATPPIYSTVGEAVSAAGARPERTVIVIAAGEYRETLDINAGLITLVGENPADAAAVRIVYDNGNPKTRPEGGTYGTSGSATVIVRRNDFKAKNLTIANDWTEGADNPESPSANQAALAIWTLADRQVYENVRFLGNQDTVAADCNGTAESLPGRQYFKDCLIEGDVDFIFGRATAVFDGCEIRSLTNRIGVGVGSSITAASTDQNTLGYLFVDTEFSADVETASGFYLGRPWNSAISGSAVNANVVIRDSVLGGHLLPAGWSDWLYQGGTDLYAADMRYFEFNNTGAGAVAASTSTRRVLSEIDAAAYTRETYLDGDADAGWWDTTRAGYWAE